jgi:hypothetical protein
MFHKKLLEILGSFTPEEVNLLRQYIISPYFRPNRENKQIVILFDILNLHNFDRNNPNLSKTKIAKTLFPKVVLINGKKHPIDNLASALFAVVKSYLGQKEMEKNQEFMQGLALAKIYRKNGFESRFIQSISNLRKQEEKTKVRYLQYHFNQYLIEEEEAQFQGLYFSFSNDTNLSNKDQKLDLFYCILKFDHLLNIASQKDKAQIALLPPKQVIDFIYQYSEPGMPFDTPIIQLYRTTLSLFNDPLNNDLFTQFCSLIEQCEFQLPVEKAKDFRAIQRNLILKKHGNYSNIENLKLVFETYKSHLQSGYLLYSNSITVSAFKNLAILALKLKKFTWIEQFFNDYPPERICGTKYPFEIHSLRRADYHYYIGEYDRALELINYKAFEDPQSSIVADVLQIKIYFETENDILEYRLKSMDQKVRRTNLADSVKNRYYNFIKKTDKLIKYGGLAKDHKKLSKLKEELISMPDIIEREWLLEKTMEALGEETKTAVPE